MTIIRISNVLSILSLVHYQGGNSPETIKSISSSARTTMSRTPILWLHIQSNIATASHTVWTRGAGIIHASCTSAACCLDSPYTPGVAYPPTTNQARNATATMNTITGNAIPILINTPVYACLLYVFGMLPITLAKMTTAKLSTRRDDRLSQHHQCQPLHPGRRRCCSCE